MKIIGLAAASLLFLSQAALAAPKARTISGSGALAFAALVAQASPLVSDADKKVLADFLDGHAKGAFPKGKKITLAAESVICRSSDVDLTAHACDLVFAGNKTAQLYGRKAHELYATLVEIGILGDGAAGTIFEAVSNLSCTIDPHEIASKDGGGASCTLTPGV